MLFDYGHAYVISLPQHQQGRAPIKRYYTGKCDPRTELEKDEWFDFVYADYIYRMNGHNHRASADVLVRVAEGIQDTEFVVRLKKQDEYMSVGKHVWHYRLTDPLFYQEAEQTGESPWSVDYVTRQLRRNKPHLWDHCKSGPIGVPRPYRRTVSCDYPKDRLAECIESHILGCCGYFGYYDVNAIYDKEVKHYKFHSPKETVVNNVCDSLIDAYEDYLFY